MCIVNRAACHNNNRINIKFLFIPYACIYTRRFNIDNITPPTRRNEIFLPRAFFFSRSKTSPHRHSVRRTRVSLIWDARTAVVVTFSFYRFEIKEDLSEKIFQRRLRLLITGFVYRTRIPRTTLRHRRNIHFAFIPFDCLPNNVRNVPASDSTFKESVSYSAERKLRVLERFIFQNN